ncbi:hypothetical protein GGR54DRAFT_591488 [Hypoxylon sp. NC1633]|nr:hypothetical protein GGR54DRAFT_591488 [Hypoxylon sp. NC1633]
MSDTHLKAYDFALEGLNLTDMESEDDDDDLSPDMAYEHDRNKDLQKRKYQTEFFAKADAMITAWNPEGTDNWLRWLPVMMLSDVIPLFQYQGDSEKKYEDYQLHTQFSRMLAGEPAENPVEGYYRLSCDGQIKPSTSHFFIPLGRLFVCMEDEDGMKLHAGSGDSPLARWTGWEVFVSHDMALWIVFDEQSLDSRYPQWYPVPCRLTENIGPGFARLLPSIRHLQRATFNEAKKSVHQTHQLGRMRTDQLGKADYDRIREEQEKKPTIHDIAKGSTTDLTSL